MRRRSRGQLGRREVVRRRGGGRIPRDGSPALPRLDRPLARLRPLPEAAGGAGVLVRDGRGRPVAAAVPRCDAWPTPRWAPTPTRRRRRRRWRNQRRRRWGLSPFCFWFCFWFCFLFCFCRDSISTAVDYMSGDDAATLSPCRILIFVLTPQVGSSQKQFFYYFFIVGGPVPVLYICETPR